MWVKQGGRRDRLAVSAPSFFPLSTAVGLSLTVAGANEADRESSTRVCVWTFWLCAAAAGLKTSSSFYCSVRRPTKKARGRGADMHLYLSAWMDCGAAETERGKSRVANTSERKNAPSSKKNAPNGVFTKKMPDTQNWGIYPVFSCMFINKGKCPKSQKMPFFPKKGH